MTPWSTVAGASPGLALAVGLATWLGWIGTGCALLRAARCGLPRPWEPLVGALVGATTWSAATAALGAAQLTSPALLIALHIGGVAIGLTWIVRRATRPHWRSASRTWWLLLPAVVVAAAGLLSAAAPADHLDATYYHLLAPRRLLEDGGLLWRRLPLNAAVLSQMLHQLGAAPLMAMGLHDAAHVASFLLWPLFLVFAHQLAVARGVPRAAAHLMVVALGAGLLPVAWYAHGGAHAYGDVAGATLALLLVAPPALPLVARAALVGVLAAAVAGSKISMAPFAAVAVVWIVGTGLRSGAPLVRVVAAATLPGVAILGPLLVVTAASSGSPFGPYLPGVLSESAYDLSELRDLLALLVDKGRYDARVVLRFATLFFTPLLWAAAVAAAATRTGRAAALLLAGQAALVAALLPADPRYLGGLQYAAAVLGVIALPGQLTQRLARPAVAGALALLLGGPWAALAVLEASPRAAVTLGVRAVEDHALERVALYEDLGALDALLPTDARLLADRHGMQAGLPAAYAPRPIALHAADLLAAPARPTFLVWIGPHPRDAIARRLAAVSQGRFELGARVYENRRARWHRRSAGERRGRLRVFEVAQR